MSDDDAAGIGIALGGCTWLLVVVAFWIACGMVVWHFIAKLW